MLSANSDRARSRSLPDDITIVWLVAIGSFCLALVWGPSPLSAQFDTVINVPPDSPPQYVAPGTQLNVYDDGELFGDYRNGTLSEVNLFGGLVYPRYVVIGDGVMNVYGGVVSEDLYVLSGGTVNVHGGLLKQVIVDREGTLGMTGGVIPTLFAGGDIHIAGGALDVIQDRSSKAITISGNDFRIDGVPFVGSLGTSSNLAGVEGSVLGGTLADGTPFVFSGGGYDPPSLDERWTLNFVELPPIDEFELTASQIDQPFGVRTGQTIHIDDNAELLHAFVAGDGSTVRVEGGSIRSILKATAAHVDVLSGHVYDLAASIGSTVDVSGGDLWRIGVESGSSVALSGGAVSRVSVGTDSSIEISGGEILGTLEVGGNSSVSVTGGQINRLERGSYSPVDGLSQVHINGGHVDHLYLRQANVTVMDGELGAFFLGDASRASIHGGRFSSGPSAAGMSSLAIEGGVLRYPRMSSDSEVTISGGEFRVASRPVDGFVDGRATVSIGPGTYLSGTLSDGTPFTFLGALDGLREIQLRLSDLPPIRPGEIIASTDPIPTGLREGQRMVVDDGGTVPDMLTMGFGSSLFVEPNGRVGDRVEATDAMVRVVGGSIGHRLSAYGETEIALEGGTIGDSFHVSHGAQLTMTGGVIESGFSVGDGGTAMVRGGVIRGHGVSVSHGGRIRLVGQDFQLDGVAIQGLDTLGQTAEVITGRASVLSGVLEDGSPFSYQGNQYVDGTRFTLEVSNAVASPAYISVPVDPAPNGARSGQTVHVLSGGSLGSDFSAIGGSRLISETGSSIGDGLAAVGAEVTVKGGSIGNSFLVASGSTVDFMGDFVGNDFRILDDNRITIRSGAIGSGMGVGNRNTFTLEGGRVEDGDDSNPAARFGNDNAIVIRGGHLGAMTKLAARNTVVIYGGSIGDKLEAQESTLISFGGSIGDFAKIEEGEFNLHSGNLGNHFKITGDSRVGLHGGSIGDSFQVYNQTQLKIEGRNFRFDGVPIGGLEPGRVQSIQRDPEAIFTGEFADGTPFVFHNSDGHHLPDQIELSVLDPLPIVARQITASVDPVPYGIRAAETLIVDDAVSRNFTAGSNSEVIVVDGGRLGDNLELYDAVAKVDGGDVGRDADAYGNSQVVVRGGRIGANFQIHRGSTLSISGGVLGDGLDNSGDQPIRIRGNHFRLNGQPLSGGFVSFSEGDILTGQLEAGESFAFDYEDGDRSPAGMNLTVTDVAPSEEGHFVSSVDELPVGLRDRQTLLVDDGGIVPDNFVAGSGSAVLLTAGTVGDNLELIHATLTMTGGTLAGKLDAYLDSQIVIRGGHVPAEIHAHSGSRVTIMGGDGWSQNYWSQVAKIEDGAELHLLGRDFTFDRNRQLSGLNRPGDTVLVEWRTGGLSATLPDGNLLPRLILGGIDNPDVSSLRLTLVGPPDLCDLNGDQKCDPVDIDLISAAIGSNDLRFDIDGDHSVDTGDLSAWLVSGGEATFGHAFLAGDVNLDGSVNAADLNVLNQNWGLETGLWSNGDLNGDGRVDAADLNRIGGQWLQASGPLRLDPITSVPEGLWPIKSGLALALLLTQINRRKRTCRHAGGQKKLMNRV